MLNLVELVPALKHLPIQQTGVVSSSGAELVAPNGYRILDVRTLRKRLEANSACVAHLGGESNTWLIKENTDSFVNRVFIVTGPAGGLAVKQALPYLRAAGESWPLPLSRAHYEQLALARQAELVPSLVPAVQLYDSKLAMIATELLQPHITLREGTIKGIAYPHLVDDMAQFLARTLFLSSDLHLPASAKRKLCESFAGNAAMCRIAECTAFTEPYMSHPNNRWTAPYLDSAVECCRADVKLKLAASRLKLKFLSSAEALLHGDLHAGSILITPEDTRIIDSEFAACGPMGFDIGTFASNLLLSYFSQAGHEAEPCGRDSYRAWILDCLTSFWGCFCGRFLELWRTQGDGDAYPGKLFAGQAGAQALETECAAYMSELWADSVGFAAADMIKRIIGIAHNLEFEMIRDRRMRARCEWRALQLARAMMLKPEGFPDPETLATAAEWHLHQPTPF